LYFRHETPFGGCGMKATYLILAAASLWVVAIPSLAPAGDSPKSTATAEEVSFPSGELTLKGFLWKPEGNGPFPIVIWNHGSEKKPGSIPSLGEFYTSKGYAFFVPHRHGSGRSPGENHMDLQKAARAQTKDDRAFQSRCVELHETYLKDVIAAVACVKQQSFVDRSHIYMSGCSFGGIQTLLAAEQGLGIEAFIPFAPAAQSWVNPLLRERLLRAVQNAKAPIFILQAENDYNLGPSIVLGKELRRKGRPNCAKVYPSYGKTTQEGHWDFAVRGTDVWGPDVFAFLDEVSKRRP
jgi:dienelactone hydrolase